MPFDPVRGQRIPKPAFAVIPAQSPSSVAAHCTADIETEAIWPL